MARQGADLDRFFLSTSPPHGPGAVACPTGEEQASGGELRRVEVDVPGSAAASRPWASSTAVKKKQTPWCRTPNQSVPAASVEAYCLTIEFLPVPLP